MMNNQNYCVARIEKNHSVIQTSLAPALWDLYLGDHSTTTEIYKLLCVRYFLFSS